MRKLIRKILEWAVREPEANYKAEAEVTNNGYVSYKSFEWHANRIANLEEDMNLLMDHLNIHVEDGKRSIVEGKGNPFEGISQLAGKVARR